MENTHTLASLCKGPFKSVTANNSEVFLDIFGCKDERSLVVLLYLHVFLSRQ